LVTWVAARLIGRSIPRQALQPGEAADRSKGRGIDGSARTLGGSARPSGCLMPECVRTILITIYSRF